MLKSTAFSSDAWSSEEGFRRWANAWIFGVDDWEGYCHKVGWQRLTQLARTTGIGGYPRSKVRVAGSGGGNDIGSSAGRLLVMMRQEKRRFIDRDLLFICRFWSKATWQWKSSFDRKEDNKITYQAEYLSKLLSAEQISMAAGRGAH